MGCTNVRTQSITHNKSGVEYNFQELPADKIQLLQSRISTSYKLTPKIIGTGRFGHVVRGSNRVFEGIKVAAKTYSLQ